MTNLAFPNYAFATKPFTCACDSRELNAATPAERENQHLATTTLGDICSICHGPVKRKGGK